MNGFDLTQPLWGLSVGQYLDLLKIAHNNIEKEKQTKKNSDNEKDLFDVQEAADYLHMAKSSLYSLNSRKKIPYIRVTGKIYYRRSALDDWLASGERKTIAQLKREVQGGDAQ